MNNEKDKLFAELFANRTTSNVVSFRDNEDDDASDDGSDDGHKIEEIVGPISLSAASEEEARDMAKEVAKRMDAYVRDPSTGKPNGAKVKRAISAVVEQVEKERQKKRDELNYKSEAEAMDMLAKYQTAKLRMASLKVGDMVERNELGLEKYKGPDRTKFQTAVVVDIFPYVQDRNESGVVNATIALAYDAKTVVTHTVDLAYYQKASPTPAASAATTSVPSVPAF